MMFQSQIKVVLYEESLLYLDLHKIDKRTLPISRDIYILPIIIIMSLVSQSRTIQFSGKDASQNKGK